MTSTPHPIGAVTQPVHNKRYERFLVTERASEPGASALSGSVCPPFAIKSTRGLNEECAYESVPQGDCSSHADCAGRHPGRCVYDSRGNGISSVSAS